MEKTIKEMVLTAVNKAIENGELQNKDNWDIERAILTAIRKEIQPVLDANDFHLSIGMEKATTIKIDGMSLFKIKRTVAKTPLYSSQLYNVVSVQVSEYGEQSANKTIAEMKARRENAEAEKNAKKQATEQAFVDALTESGLSGKEFLELMKKYQATEFYYRHEFEMDNK